MKLVSKMTRATQSAAVALGVMVATLATPATAQFQAGYIQTLSVTSTRGASEMDQLYAAGTGSASLTRVCLINMGSVQRSFTHAVQGINPLRAAPGGQSCANFNASDRVAFGMVDGVEPAQANRAMVMSLSAFSGGTVTFLWR